MTTYTVLAPARAPETPPDPTAYVFVKDGFCWPAIFFPVIWLIFRRQWLVLLLYVAVAVLFLAFTTPLGGGTPVAIYLLGRLLFALEANGLRRWTLERNGFVLVDVIEARNSREAELRFFAGWPVEPVPPTPPSPTMVATPPSPVEPPRPPSAEAGDLIGLFPTPGGAA